MQVWDDLLEDLEEVLDGYWIVSDTGGSRVGLWVGSKVKTKQLLSVHCHRHNVKNQSFCMGPNDT